MRLFGCKPEQVEDLPEMDPSMELLGMDNVKKYQTMVGSLQWVVSTGLCYDIAIAVKTLCGFFAYPRQGHFIHAKRIYGHVYYKMLCKNAMVTTVVPGPLVPLVQ
ncbi:MAG: hypothetical protein ACRCZI_04015 [Cetobacterium sp.]